MTEVTHILSQIESGDPSASEKLLPLVYDELRKLAEARMSSERPDHTLEATALVHEAYLRLVDVEQVQHWDSRGHFFSVAAEAMRRILIEMARRKRTLKQGGDYVRQELAEGKITTPKVRRDLLAINDALDLLTDTDSQAAELVKLRYFAGLTSEQAAQILGISPRTADRIWVYARSFLLREVEQD